MADETTTEMLAETEGQAAYTPPDGWRVLQLGEIVQKNDVFLAVNEERWPAKRVGKTVNNNRYLRRIEVEQPKPVQVREGRWRTRGGQEIPVTAMPTDHTMYLPGYPWWDGDGNTWKNNGGYYKNGEAAEDLVQYLGPIEQPEPGTIITPDDVAGEALARAINEWPSVQIVRREVEELQAELGLAKRRVVELETLVADLRTINDAQEKAVRSAGRENTDLQHRLSVVSSECAEQVATCNGLRQQLEAVKAELVAQAETSRRLQIELDAREQVPEAVSDRFEEGWDAGTARAVETIAEWTEPFRRCGSERLVWMVMQNLPHIMRSLTGLTEED